MDEAKPEHGLTRLRSTLRLLYHGSSTTALRFQFAVLLVDLAIIAFFIATPLLRDRPSFIWIDIAVAMLLLSEPHREILTLRHIDELSYAEIAEVLEVPKGTVMSRLHAARRGLREALERAG